MYPSSEYPRLEKKNKSALPCFECESCKEGSYATCSNYDYYGSRRDGGMTEYIAVKEWNVLLMPEDMSYDEGAMCEPTSIRLRLRLYV